MTGAALLATRGNRSSYGTDDYAEADRLRRDLNQLGFAVRIVTRLRSGGNKSGLGTYRVTWWPKPE